MNLALQKRNEQLERWRQNEAELIEKQQVLEDNNNNNNKNNDSNNNHISSSRRHISSTNNNNNYSSTSNSSSSKNFNSKNNYNNNDDDDDNNKKTFHKKKKAHVKFTHSTLFLEACANGDIDECKRLLDNKLVDINVTTCDGLTGLHEAAICGNAELVVYLIENGANINCCDNEGWTPLHAAASLGQSGIVEILLEHGADCTSVNCEDFLAYDLARTEEVKKLLSEKLEELADDLEVLRRQEERAIERDIERWLKSGIYEERSHPVTKATVLHVIAAKGYIRLMRKLLDEPKLKRQVKLEARDSEGYTPLLAASFWNQNEIVELLIEHGANIFAQADNGYKISSIHLQNYQQSKMNQPSAQVKARSSFQSLDSATSATNSPSGSIDLARSSQATSSDSLIQADEQSELARKQLAAAERTSNIPSGAKSQLQQQQLHKSRSLEIERQRRDSSPPLLHSSMSVDRLILRSESMGERDLRKSFKELVLENDKLRRQLVELRDQDNSSTKHNQPDDWTRRERQLQRKISELEEESKQLDQLRLEIQRLKDENSSLIRVVSKLSKQQQQKQY